jgi:hypothetical protein
MRLYLKSVVVGMIAALMASTLWVLAVVVLPIVLPIIAERAAQTFGPLGGAETGSGGIGAVSVGVNEIPILAAAVVGFVAGFLWSVRRISKLSPSRHGGTTSPPSTTA